MIMTESDQRKAELREECAALWGGFLDRLERQPHITPALKESVRKLREVHDRAIVERDTLDPEEPTDERAAFVALELVAQVPIVGRLTLDQAAREAMRVAWEAVQSGDESMAETCVLASFWCWRALN